MFRRIGSISIEKSGQARGLVECSEEGGVVLESVTARGGGQSENFRINNGGKDGANVREEVLQIEYNSKERRYEKSLGKSVDGGGKGGRREKRKMGFAFCEFVFGRRGVNSALVSRQKYIL